MNSEQNLSRYRPQSSGLPFVGILRKLMELSLKHNVNYYKLNATCVTFEKFVLSNS